jgi:hypothetical protein
MPKSTRNSEDSRFNELEFEENMAALNLSDENFEIRNVPHSRSLNDTALNNQQLRENFRSFSIYFTTNIYGPKGSKKLRENVYLLENEKLYYPNHALRILKKNFQIEYAAQFKIIWLDLKNEYNNENSIVVFSF